MPPCAGEALDGANKYKCPKQQKAVRAVKRMTVDAAPNVLMIQLKRFEFSFSGHKISKKVGRRSYLCVGGSFAGAGVAGFGVQGTGAGSSPLAQPAQARCL